MVLDVVGLVMSGVALAVSVFVFWRTYLRGFRLHVRNAGRVTVGKDPWFNLQRVLIAIDLLFFNEGSSRGSVEDLAVDLKTPQGSVLLRAFLIQTDRQKQWQKELLPPQAESFLSFDLSPGEAMLKEVIFVPNDNAQSAVVSGAYEVNLWVYSSGSKEWKKHDSFPVSVTSDDVKEIDKSTITPQPDGRLYVNWKTRDKPTDASDKRFEKLRSLIRT